MTCSELMTWDPAFCVPEDTAVTAAMIMKNHDIGSVPVVNDRNEKGLIGILTDRDLTIRVVAEQRDYYKTSVSDIMSKNVTACRVSDDSEEVAAAMAKRQVRRVPVVDDNNRLVGIISQADLAGKMKSRAVGQMVEQISEPASEHNKSGLSSVMMIAGGLGIGAGIAYLVDPEWAGQTTRKVMDKIRTTAGRVGEEVQSAAEEGIS